MIIAGSGTVESDGGSESNDEPELTTLDPPASPPSTLPAESPATAPMDLLKNPFLLPAQFLALNPNLYAAQFAQLQAAQLLLTKQNEEAGPRKRNAEDDSPLDLGSKPKYARASPPLGESPLDLSGNKSPELKPETSPFNPLLPPNILSFFNHLKPPVSGAADFSNLLSLAANHSPPTSSPPRSSNPWQTPPTSSPSRSSNPWQNQWLNKNSSEGGRIGDVFKCVWCKESYQTLEALTHHMKEAKHHSMPHPGLPGPGSMRQMPASSPSRSPSSMASPLSSVSTSPKPSQAPVRDILKEQLPLPRKLVRGQDIWIGRADQQTRDILKCMGCGQSFRSLDLLTKHMQETQHYKKVISHDQLSAWKYPETQHTSKNHINSVLTCKVCEKAFGSLKDLSEHMLKANHYTGESPRGPRPPLPSPSALAKERKKALPVKKLLELERARYEVVGGPLGSKAAAASARDIMETGKLLCERCDDRVPLELFIGHIQQCVGKTRAAVKSEEAVDPTEQDKRNDGNASILGSLEQMVKGRNFQASGGGRKLPSSSPSSVPSSSPLQPPLYGMGRMAMSSMVGGTPSLDVGTPNIGVSTPSVGVGTPVPGSPSSNSSASKPSSPALRSLEKSAESPGGQTNGKIKQEIDSNNQTDGSAASPVPSHLSSPSPSEINDAPIMKRIESPDPDIKVEKCDPALTMSPPPPAKSDNPLAALQMLCDTQRKTPKTPKIAESGNPMSDPGAMMAFSWACNQAVGSDSAIKCPFCDTPFISKGAYRHHLSKMHFKEYQQSGFPVPGARSPSPDAKEDESIQSKYAKYAQLAKLQLSCNQK